MKLIYVSFVVISMVLGIGSASAQGGGVVSPGTGVGSSTAGTNQSQPGALSGSAPQQPATIPQPGITQPGLQQPGTLPGSTTGGINENNTLTAPGLSQTAPLPTVTPNTVAPVTPGTLGNPPAAQPNP